MLYIRETDDTDLEKILFVEKEAFGIDKEAELTRDILADPSAEPILSLLAFVDEQPVGHILFSKGQVLGNPELSVSILAPLAVLPNFQRQRIGGELIKKGLQKRSADGVDIMFVLGHPDYYPRHGFVPAGKLGFEAPFPIPEKVADAWMVQELRPNVIGSVSGKVICCDALNKPEHWHE
ncbi:MAG: GNAT family N-acetyltransferase [Candidatus Bathyarchaeum sp.]|nr:MAG: GNAT family N-acetyltransferase [Candidatus Bathyarchaeum sp.]